MTETSADRCRRYRRRILEISRQVPAAHVAPAFSCVEIVDALYHDVMREQDVFIMSKGHGCLAQYVVLEDIGVLSHDDLDEYCRGEDTLGTHPDYDLVRGIHASTGSLGHGLGIAAGQALAEKLRGSDVRVYVLLSDGECQEGSTWETVMVAANLRLDNLVAVVDYNDWGGMERMSEAFPALTPLTLKWDAFEWKAHGFDGHGMGPFGMQNFSQWIASRSVGMPRVAICDTTKGKGVSFMEDEPIWHYRSPNDEEYVRAMEELA